MKYLNKYITTIILICLYTSINGQAIQQYTNSVSEPSPQIAAVGKFIDTPIDYFTGVPNISIPLTNITEGTLNVNLGLAYHAGGIKIEEVASNVGLNWILTGGGVINRTTLGLNDDHPEKGITHKLDDLLEVRYGLPTSEAVEQIFAAGNGSLDTEKIYLVFNILVVLVNLL